MAISSSVKRFFELSGSSQLKAGTEPVEAKHRTDAGRIDRAALLAHVLDASRIIMISLERRGMKERKTPKSELN